LLVAAMWTARRRYNCRVRSAACVNRIGGLAVALGVGSAVFAGQGMAWAAPSTSLDASAAGSPGQSPSKGSSSAGPNTGKPGSASAPSQTSAASRGSAPRPGRAGSQSSRTTPDLTSSKGSKRSSDDPKPATAFSGEDGSDAYAETDIAPSDSAPAANVDATQLVTESPKAFTVVSTPVDPITEAQRQAPAPAEVAVDPLGVVTGVISKVVGGLLNPLSVNDTPEAPAIVPTLWSLVAFTRREFETTMASPSVTDPSANLLTTSETLTAMSSAQSDQRTLILSAFPAEADAILARTTLDPNPAVVVDGHHFYLGTLGGKKVIVAMTGIGIVNATDTTRAALDHFTRESGTPIGAVVFSGVAGGSGRTEIGDVAVPARWTLDGGTTWHAVDPGMLAAASTLTPDLMSTDTIGDPASPFDPLGRLQLVDLKREPQLFVGGDGSTSDNNNGTAFPALPSIPIIGDIFGAQPFRAPDFSPLFTGNLIPALVPFLANGLISNATGFFAATPPAVDAVDQETAAVQAVADAHGIPFLGIRGMSDGPGDPLHLPGYPFTFVVYKQIAADNAAIVAQAFMQNWTGG
jgi:nucleoside phosphorylase